MGTLISVGAESIAIRVAGRPGALTIPFGDVRRVEVSEGRVGRFDDGLAVGAIGGAAFGLVLGAITYTPCDAFVCVADFGPAGAALGGALLGGLAGGLLGGVIGSLFSEEVWKPLHFAPHAPQLKLDFATRSANPGFVIPW
jgi:hypothetical protein